MRVIIGHWGHEANTFAEQMINFDRYTGRGITYGQDSIAANDGVPSYLGGIIKACKEEGIEPVPALAYTAAAPVLDKDCTKRMLDSILEVCRENKGKVDGVCIALHGAGVSEIADDLEAYTLREIRKILGDDIPITVPLDLHGNISDEMAELTQGLFGIRKYPHTDKADASYLAMKTLARILKDGLKTETKVVHLPMLLPISAGQTAKPPFPEMEAYFKKYVEDHDLVDASLFHGFPYADVKDSSVSVVVVAKHDAKSAADHLAKYVWDKRYEFKIESNTTKQALTLATQVEKDGYIVINEASDNPGGGCPGDGTHLLREMLERDLPKSIFGYIVDPEAVEEIFQYRVGDKVSLKLGGKHEAIFGAPLEIKDATIVCLSDGVFYHTTPTLCGLRANLGKCARIRVSNVDIIVGSVSNQTFDNQPFLVTGADINNYRYVGLKSTQHFRAYFTDKAAAIINCDPPGLNSSDLTCFDYKKIARPIFPLDDNVTF